MAAGTTRSRSRSPVDGGLTWSAPRASTAMLFRACTHPERRDPRRWNHRRRVATTFAATRPILRRFHRLLASRPRATASRGASASSRPFDLCEGPPVGGRYFLGDYMGMASAGNSFAVAFGAPRAMRATARTSRRAFARPSLQTPAARVGPPSTKARPGRTARRRDRRRDPRGRGDGASLRAL